MDAFVVNVPSPVGSFGVAGNADELTAIFLPHERHRASRGAAPTVVARAVIELEEYLAGDRTRFDLRLAEVQATDFQRDVWSGLVAIPYGEVRTYTEIAASVGHPRAFRAVGNANHVNPFPVVVPCHRVVASRGLGGYGGGGEVKRFLLSLEGARF
ncbi:MAG: methylated-DNA--[protein]-cysteine S-methyltransferase [Acidimicrobiales bacterium]